MWPKATTIIEGGGDTLKPTTNIATERKYRLLVVGRMEYSKLGLPMWPFSVYCVSVPNYLGKLHIFLYNNWFHVN